MKRGATPKFKDLGSSPMTNSSPAKFEEQAGAGSYDAEGNYIPYEGNASMGAVYNPFQGISNINKGIKNYQATGEVAGGTASEAEMNYDDVLTDEDLDRNMWSGTIFGKKRDKRRAKRIEELEAQDKMGIDRERIVARQGAPAGV